MRDKESRLLAMVGRRRRELIAVADALSAEQLTFRPVPGSWSTLDVIEHLVKVEEAIAPRVRPSEPRRLAETLKTRASLATARVLFALGGRMKVPVQAIVPLGGATLGDLVARWEAAGAVLGERLEAFGPQDWSRPMMRHPLLGPLTPSEGLAFIRWHMGHHGRQIARIRRARGYPAA